MNIRLYAKAVVAFVTTSCASLKFALNDDVITTGDWLDIVAAVTIVTAAVFGISNQKLS